MVRECFNFVFPLISSFSLKVVCTLSRSDITFLTCSSSHIPFISSYSISPSGGAGVAEQIADLKRGSEIVVCTPGRMIDILCMQAGKLVSLKRVTMVVMDEADRYAK